MKSIGVRDPLGTVLAGGLTGRPFLEALRREVAATAGVGHSLLGRMSTDPRSRADFCVIALQHYPLVTVFTRYLEMLLLAAPDSEAKMWLAKVLVDEYGEGSRGLDHASLYRNFLRATGVPEGQERKARLHPAVVEFIFEHLRIAAREPFLVGLGAVGPGHEWAIPAMFARMIQGLRAAGFADGQIEYFLLHVEQDKDHGAWLEEALVRYALTPEACGQIRKGALLSLALREQFWWGVADKLNAERMRQRTGLSPSTAGSESRELTLEELEQLVCPRVEFPFDSPAGSTGVPNWAAQGGLEGELMKTESPKAPCGNN